MDKLVHRRWHHRMLIVVSGFVPDIMLLRVADEYALPYRQLTLDGGIRLMPRRAWLLKAVSKCDPRSVVTAGWQDITTQCSNSAWSTVLMVAFVKGVATWHLVSLLVK